MSLISHIHQQLADAEKQAGEGQCFIGHEFRNKDLRKKLERALSSLPGTKLQPYFADSEVTGGFILEKICKKILATRATIVDLTTANPNVYFELGLAIGLNKPIFVVLKQQTVVPSVLESFVKLHFTSYTELEEHLVIQVPAWLEQSIEYHLRYNNHCHFVNLRCPDRQRITPQRRYLLIDHLKGIDEVTQSAYDRDLQHELLSALARFHFEPTSLYKIPLESSFRLCDYCRSLRDSSFAFCHLTSQSSLDVYFLLGLATGLDIPSLLIVQKERFDSVHKPFEIPSMLKGLDLFEYEHYDEISERLGNEVESFLNAKKYQPIANRVLTFPEAWRRVGEQEDQAQRESSETAQTEAQTALQQQLLEIKSMNDPQEQLSMLIQLSQELADQEDAAGLRETLLIVRSFTHSAQQVGMLVAMVEALVRLNDSEGLRRVVEMVLGEESGKIQDPVLEAAVRAYERLGDNEKASEVAALLERKVDSASSLTSRAFSRLYPEDNAVKSNTLEAQQFSEDDDIQDEPKYFKTNNKKFRSRPMSIIERVAQNEGVYDMKAAHDQTKFRVYKITLKEVERVLQLENIAKASLSAIKTALNDIENGFIYLLNRSKVNKRDIRIVMPKLIDAKAYLATALTELEPKGRGKTFEYFQSLSKCRFLIFEINQLLEE